MSSASSSSSSTTVALAWIVCASAAGRFDWLCYCRGGRLQSQSSVGGTEPANELNPLPIVVFVVHQMTGHRCEVIVAVARTRDILRIIAHVDDHCRYPRRSRAHHSARSRSCPLPRWHANRRTRARSLTDDRGLRGGRVRRTAPVPFSISASPVLGVAVCSCGVRPAQHAVYVFTLLFNDTDQTQYTFRVKLLVEHFKEVHSSVQLRCLRLSGVVACPQDRLADLNIGIVVRGAFVMPTIGVRIQTWCSSLLEDFFASR